ncbi:MAG: aromatic ring-hydroxylating dioxygenase subunit alpha [Gaiellaceae bacterium]
MAAGARTLPWSWYSDPEILRAEQERIFRRSWHYVGHAAEVEHSGDRLPGWAGETPVLVVRDEEGELRAFLNVCRHRGSLLVAEAGRRETIQCPYHAWTYGLDGSLRRAPRSEREPGLDLDDVALRPVQVGTWGPFVFVNPDIEAEPLESALGELPRLAEEHGLDVDAVRFRERAHYALAANWKVATENYLECYHCPVAHRGFSALVDVGADAYALEARPGLWSQFGAARNGAGECQFHLLWPAFRLNVFPGFTNVSVGPLRPDGAGRCVGFLDYFFGEEVEDAAAAELIALDEEIGREDRALVESVQLGVASGLVEHGRLLPVSERLIAGFQQRVSEALAG